MSAALANPGSHQIGCICLTQPVLSKFSGEPSYSIEDTVLVNRIFQITCPGKMKHFLLPALLVAWNVSIARAESPAVTMPDEHRALLESHCIKCHDAKEQNGQVRLDDLDFNITNIETAERWQKILNVLNAGEMPPEKEQPLPKEAKTEFLDDLANLMVAARKKLNDQGGAITMRRLNRREYANTLHEILGVKINVSELPSDSGTGGFDTIGQNLFISATQIEQYQSLGREALEEAFARLAEASAERSLQDRSIELSLRQEEKQATSIPSAQARFNIHTNRQVSSISAAGLRIVRFECETANEKVAAYVTEQIKARQRAQDWVEAVDRAAANPKNQEVVAELKKSERRPGEYRRSWEKIDGAPSPESFGFQTGENNADKAHGALGDNWQKYHEYYLTRPSLDRGAYLGVKALHPSLMALGHLELPVPDSWKSGDYVFRVRLAAAADSQPEQRFLEIGLHPRNGKVLANFEITGTIDEPQIVEMPFTLTREQVDAGDRTLWLREKGSWDNNDEGIRKRQEAVKQNGIAPVLALWIDWMEIERVSEIGRPLPLGLQALDGLLTATPNSPKDSDVRTALTRFATVAFRGRAPAEGYIQQLCSVYNTHLKSGATATTALKDTLSIILASPMFLYLTEPEVDTQQRTLSDLELATRLSYFLWSAPPDERLLELAGNGELSKPAVLEAQTTRLLDDPQADELVAGFVSQWLNMERFEFFEVNRPRFPRFDDSTRLSAKNEVYQTFAYILRHDAPLSDLLKADYVVIDPVLAHFYGIDGCTESTGGEISQSLRPEAAYQSSNRDAHFRGDSFRKVSVPADSPRGGLLGMAAINFMGGNGEQTSPVERGVWVLRKLLNDPPPPAPANVPQIERLAGKVLTTHERLLAHQEDPQCASCHRKIDPIGFGLENFDPVGQWRTEDSYQVRDENGQPVEGASKTWTIEASATLHAGPTFNNFFELREFIASQPDDFAAGFSAALIEYALGRPVGFSDEPLIQNMVRAAKKKNFSTREFIYALTASETFNSK